MYHQRGTVLHQLKRFGEARDDFARALARAPRNAVVWNLRGLCDAQLGDVAAARDAYARATRLDARFKEAWANLAQLERDAGNAGAAAECFHSAMESARQTQQQGAFNESKMELGLLQGSLEFDDWMRQIKPEGAEGGGPDA